MPVNAAGYEYDPYFAPGGGGAQYSSGWDNNWNTNANTNTNQPSNNYSFNAPSNSGSNYYGNSNTGGTGGNTNYNPYTGALSNWGNQSGRNFGQFSGTQQQSTDTTRQSSQANQQGRFGEVFNNLDTQYGLTSAYGSEFQQSFEEALMNSLVQNQSLQSTSVDDPIGYLPLVLSELGMTTDQSAAGSQGLQSILYGNTPQFDAQAWQRMQQQSIGENVAMAMSQPGMLGLGETDQQRQAAFAGAAAGTPLAQASLEAQSQYDFNNLAAQIQAADTLESSRRDLVQTLLPTLTQYFGSTSEGMSTQETQQLNQISSMLTNQYMQQQVTQSIAQQIGESSGWSEEQVNTFAESLSQTLAESYGSILGTAAEGGGGKWICSVCVAHGWIPFEKLVWEQAIIKLNPHLFEKARKGYDRWGLSLAKWLQDKPRVSRFIAPFAEAFMDYIGGARRWHNRWMFKFVIKTSELFAR
jgi:hypothetical protein